MGSKTLTLILQPRSWCCARIYSAGIVLSRRIHYTNFLPAGETGGSGQQLAEAKHTRHDVSSSTYGALMDSAKTQSQLCNREQFGLVLKEFMSREKYRRGHVSFINMALARMEEFQLEKDLLTYNRILDVFPKGRYKPKRLLDALWPRPLPQTELALELLTRMEDNNVWPDDITYSLLVEVFGRHSLPVEKCERMAYWYSRYRDADPYWIEGDLPVEPAELSRLALRRIVGNDDIIEYEMSSAGQGFILSGHSEAQLQILHQLSSSQSSLFHVEGPHRIWVNKSPVHYFSLRLAPNNDTGEASEGAVVAVCSCQPESQATLQWWIKELQLVHPHLTHATILYDIRTEESSSLLLDERERILLADTFRESA